MKVKEYIEKNFSSLKGSYDTIAVNDAELAQGVQIFLSADSKLEAILADRPVKKFLGFEIIRELKREQTLILVVAQPLNGDYYFFECLGLIYDSNLTGLPYDNLTPAATFKSDREARSAAANYEAELYKYTYKDGERVDSKLLYDPYDCFN